MLTNTAPVYLAFCTISRVVAAPGGQRSIVLFKNHITQEQATSHIEYVSGRFGSILGNRSVSNSAEVEWQYHKILNGYTVDINHDILADLKTHEDILSVTPEGEFKLCDELIRVELKSRDARTCSVGEQAESQCAADMSYAPIVVKDVGWNLARISHQSVAKARSDPTYIYRPDPPRKKDELAPIIYIVDTGVLLEHEDFDGRITAGPTFTTDKGKKKKAALYWGHGTQVAGLAMGKSLGVARSPDIRGISIKVRGEDGRMRDGDVISAIEWIIQQPHPNNLKVINVSFTKSFDEPINEVFRRAGNLGIHVVVGAGNDNQDAYLMSPQSVQNIITVGAIDPQGEKTRFSNYGVDFVAPGLGLLTTSHTGKDQAVYASGTSMAAPHVTGVLAYLLRIHGSMSPSEAFLFLHSLAIEEADDFPGEVPAKVIYNGGAGKNPLTRTMSCMDL